LRFQAKSATDFQLPEQVAPDSHVGVLQLPPPVQLKVQVDPALHTTVGQLAPPPVHEKSQIDPEAQVTFRFSQLPGPSEQLLVQRTEVQCAVPLQVVPPFEQFKLQLEPAAHCTRSQCPES
jgi:hypothetical protein